MELFTVFGIMITCILISLILYLLLSNIFLSNMSNTDTKGVELGYIMAFIIIASLISMMFAMFSVYPESFGYQKIQTVSENDIKG